MAPVKSLDRKDKIAQLLKEMQNGLLERESHAKLILLAALAGEHVLLLGPPGTAKSELAKRLKNVFVEAGYFERLLTRFSVPEELFGPLSIQALEQDRYQRLTSGYLPEASIAFIDEIFKANSAILNSLLTLLNERQFDNGNRRSDVPLISVIAASNELPEGEELDALYDRFMLRSFVQPVSDEAFRQLLRLEGDVCDPALELRLRIEDLEEVRALAEKVRLSPEVLKLCEAFRGYLAEQQIYVSDRRWRKIINLLKVSAFTNKENEVSIFDAWLMPHCLWQKPEQLDGLLGFYKENIAIDGDYQPRRQTEVILAWENKLASDWENKFQSSDEHGKPLFYNQKGGTTTSNSRKDQKKDAKGRPLYLDSSGNETTTKQNSYGRDNEALYEAVANAPVMQTVAYSFAHINSRVKQIEGFKKALHASLLKLQQQNRSAEQTLIEHLWVDESIWPELSQSLSNAIEQTEKLLARAEKVTKGFRSLPLEDSDEGALGVEASALEGELSD
ncbi:ATPase [Marinobacterium aestuarii]|uniref:ATPase n=2 Tax=Marinobacterium aestuarii TaxID=1821621 RepID=A0A1A9F650_9GAMM|nr:ATPase [Marinobacterium aestuarii]